MGVQAGGQTQGTLVTGETWFQPNPTSWPYTTYVTNNVSLQDYANELDVEEGEFDAVLRFYRRRKSSRSLIKELTVPLAMLEMLNVPKKKRGK
jgi:hypothetical protein